MWTSVEKESRNLPCRINQSGSDPFPRKMESMSVRNRSIDHEKNISQEKLAELANINMRSISMLENGLTNVKFLTLYKIAEALEVE